MVQVQFEAPTEGDAERWAEAVNRESNRANQAKQALMKVHPELSAITYLSSVKPDSLAPGGWAPTQMCSMDETQARKNLKHGGLHNTRSINAERICRVYPQGRRIASDNMDACEYATYLAAGFQMVALNMQTADEATQYQHAFFEQNGACGYVLPRPLAPPGRGMALEVRLMGAWHLPKPDEGRVDDADPPPWRGIYPKLDTPEAIPGGARRGRHHRHSLRRRRRLRLCDAQARQRLAKEPKGQC